jgi:nitrate reductase gamma subunit
MTMALLLIAGVAVFVVGNLLRVVKFLRMPAHLRWDLYPIRKGPRERQRYGGSYFEQSEWWTKPQESGRGGELVFMLKEVLLLRGVWENFRSLWPWSFLLHWGMYAYIVATALALMSSSFAPVAYSLAAISGIIGALGLTLMRVLGPRLRPFTTRGAVFNLVLLGAISASSALPRFDEGELPALVARLVHSPFDIPLSQLSPVLIAHICLVAFFLAYFPFTHMTHAYMKYFTWHGIRWDDQPAIFDSRSEQTLSTNIARPASWSAIHIAATGPRPWAEVVASDRGEGGPDA